MNKFVAIAALTLSANFAISATTITVYGYGADRERAKLDAFKTATENVCGSNVLSSREHFNNKTTHNKVLAYSSCRIQNYRVIEETEGKILIEADIEKINLSDRLSNTSNNRMVFDQNQLNAQLKTYQAEKQLGDELIDEIFRDYPYQAYELRKTKKPYIVDDVARNFYLVIPYELHWNKNYINTVRETMTLLQAKQGVGTVTILAHNPNKLLGYTSYHNLNDVHRIDRIKSKMTGKNEVRLQIVARDTKGRHVVDFCYSPEYRAGGIFYSVGVKNNISFFGDDKNSGELKVRLTVPAEVIYDITIDIVAERNCKLYAPPL
jgi:hypothetical protein